MRVLHAPVFEGNHYQRSLFNSLEELGVEVVREGLAVPLSPFVHHLLLDDIDIVHLHWTHPYFLFGSKHILYRIPLSSVFCRIAAVVFVLQVWVTTKLCDRVVWTVHNKCNHERRYESLDKWVTRRLLHMVDAVQVWDEETERELSDYAETDLPETHQIPHGNYCNVYDEVSRESSRDCLDIDVDERVYLYFGVIRPYKNVPQLIKAFDEPPNARLIVAGNPKSDALEKQIRLLAAERNNVEIVLGYVPDDLVPVYFGAADCVILPYRHIFNSGSVLLAMSLGRPVVAPDMGSISSVLPEGNIVYDELESGLRDAESKSFDELRDTGRRNKQIADSEYSWASVGSRIKRMYESESAV